MDRLLIAEVRFGTRGHHEAVRNLASRPLDPVSGRTIAICALTGSPDARLFAALDPVSGEIVGALSMREVTVEDRLEVQIINLGVTVNRQGHGSALVKRVLGDYPGDRVWLKSRPEVVGFYEKLGFKPTGGKVGDLLVMEVKP